LEEICLGKRQNQKRQKSGGGLRKRRTRKKKEGEEKNEVRRTDEVGGYQKLHAKVEDREEGSIRGG